MEVTLDDGLIKEGRGGEGRRGRRARMEAVEEGRDG